MTIAHINIHQQTLSHTGFIDDAYINRLITDRVKYICVTEHRIKYSQTALNLVYLVVDPSYLGPYLACASIPFSFDVDGYIKYTEPFL